MRHRRLLTVAAGVAAAMAIAAPAGAQTIQPGAAMVADGSYCTLSWIFDGGGATYVSTAAHCVPRGPGQRVSLAEAPLGPAIEEIGTVEFIGNAEQEGRDYAFIRIDDEDLGQVSASMKGSPTVPTGVSTRATAAEGDVIQFSGHGLGFHATQPTREWRLGVLNRMAEREHDVLGPVISGDSGGPVANLSDQGKALGIVNTVGAGVNSDALAVVVAGEGGTNLEFVLADAASHGFVVSLRTAG